ncbi:hypothetical protein MWU75_10175 [Ornithinimicrobium sp. F0845]|uniref:hypothetical protein n=1 Tax=Ornithinimicrobium sp. F0845 TaxID=2926412 RepID=UPI001FF287DD|nr:hypothetical protein [Ornithinimicrobium sp. F0845]MCK0112504.1 hypothetical protein [Ornithinimicrobium sp. F0845]
MKTASKHRTDGLVRTLQTKRAQRAADPTRSGRRTFAHHLATSLAAPNVGMTVPYRDAPR